MELFARDDEEGIMKTKSSFIANRIHDGTIATLKDAIRADGRYNLGEEIPERDVEDIFEFLKSLTGEYRGRPVL